MGIGEGTEELTGGLVVVVPYLVQFLPRPPDNDGVLYSVVSSRLFALIAFVGRERGSEGRVDGVGTGKEGGREGVDGVAVLPSLRRNPLYLSLNTYFGGCLESGRHRSRSGSGKAPSPLRGSQNVPVTS